MSRAWFKFFGRDFRDGVRGALSLEETGAYTILLSLIYETDNRLADDERMICAQLNIDPRVWRRIRTRLIECKKLTLADGFLTNLRATSELSTAQHIAEVRQTSGRSGGQQSGKVRAKALKTNDPPEANASNSLLYARAFQNTEPESDTPSLRSGGPRTRTSKTTIPPDAKLNDAGRGYASEHGIVNGNADAVWEHFRDHHHANGNRFVDWDAAWRNWVRKQAQFSGTSGAQAQRPQRPSMATVIKRMQAEGKLV